VARSVDKRPENLARFYGDEPEGAWTLEERDAQRRAMAASLERAEEMAAAEAAQGDSRRRHALDSLYRFLERPCYMGGTRAFCYGARRAARERCWVLVPPAVRAALFFGARLSTTKFAYQRPPKAF
jgi:hypothetical protein